MLLTTELTEEQLAHLKEMQQRSGAADLGSVVIAAIMAYNPSAPAKTEAVEEHQS